MPTFGGEDNQKKTVWSSNAQPILKELGQQDVKSRPTVRHCDDLSGVRFYTAQLFAHSGPAISNCGLLDGDWHNYCWYRRDVLLRWVYHGERMMMLTG